MTCNGHFVSFFPLSYFSTFNFVYFYIPVIIHLFRFPIFYLSLPSFYLLFFICSIYFAFLFFIWVYLLSIFFSLFVPFITLSHFLSGSTFFLSSFLYLFHLFRFPIFYLGLPSFYLLFFICSLYFAFLFLFILLYCSFPFISFLTPTFSFYLPRSLFSSCIFSPIKFRLLFLHFLCPFFAYLFIPAFLRPLCPAVCCQLSLQGRLARISALQKWILLVQYEPHPKTLWHCAKARNQQGRAATEGTVILTSVT